MMTAPDRIGLPFRSESYLENRTQRFPQRKTLLVKLVRLSLDMSGWKERRDVNLSGGVEAFWGLTDSMKRKDKVLCHTVRVCLCVCVCSCVYVSVSACVSAHACAFDYVTERWSKNQEDRTWLHHSPRSLTAHRQKDCCRQGNECSHNANILPSSLCLFLATRLKGGQMQWQIVVFGLNGCCFLLCLSAFVNRPKEKHSGQPAVMIRPNTVVLSVQTQTDVDTQTHACGYFKGMCPGQWRSSEDR